MTAAERETAIIEAYRNGTKVTAIESQFEVARSTLYHILKRSGVKPARTNRQREAGSRDQTLAGLHELIRHQDQLIEEQAQELAKLRRQLNGGAKSTRARRTAG